MWAPARLRIVGEAATRGLLMMVMLRRMRTRQAYGEGEGRDALVSEDAFGG